MAISSEMIIGEARARGRNGSCAKKIRKLSRTVAPIGKV